MTIHWLNGGGSLAWAAFTPEKNGEVEVVAILGAVQYIYRTMPAEEARGIYRDLEAKGWTRKTQADAKAAKVDVHWLCLMIRD